MKAILTVMLVFAIGTCTLAQTKTSGVSPYLFPGFVTANVLQKGGGVTAGTMNYNTLTQEMLFMQGDVKTVLDMDNVDTIYLESRRFIHVGAVYYEKLTDTKIALYEQHFNKLLLHGKNPDLEEQVNNNITASQGIKNSSTSSSKYELKLGDGYELVPQNVFWLQKGKSFYSAADLKKIIKVFPDKEQAINAYIKDAGLDINKAADLAKLIVFCNK